MKIETNVFEAFNDFVQIIDENKKVLYANSVAKIAFGNKSMCHIFQLFLESGSEQSFEYNNEFYKVCIQIISWNEQEAYMIVAKKDSLFSNRINQMVIDALNNDYMSMAIVDVKNKKSQVLALKAKRVTTIPQEYDYYDMCFRCIEKYVSDEEKPHIEKAIQLDFVQNKLTEKNEFGFIFNVNFYGQEHTCQLKYIHLDIPDYIFMGFRFVDGILASEKQQNQDLRIQLKLAQNDRILMQALCSDYNAAYYCDLNMDYIEPIKCKSYSYANDIKEEYSFSKFIQHSYDTFVIHESCPDYLQLFCAKSIKNALKNQNRISYHVQTLPNPMGMQYFEVHIVKLFENEDSYRVIIGYRPIDDIVRKEKVNQENLQLALALAKKANDAKSNFLFNMSHDIRTPMNAILGFNDLIALNSSDEKKVVEYSHKIQQSGLYLLSLIDDILEMSRIESGKLTLDENVIHTQEFNDSIAVIFENQMKEKNIEFIRKLDVKSHYLYCDLVKLKEILVNILSNAYKYTMPGGKITFEVTEISKDKDMVYFKSVIEDTGIGMSQDFLNHIFDSFSQERTSTESGQQGTGLGMAITKRLVDLMHGTIEVESKLGVGTRVTVVLPHHLADEKVYKSMENSLKDYTVDLKGKRILLAEDNDLNMEIVKELLARMHIQVEHARNGIECIAMLEKHENHYYDAILMDILMPEMNGYKATQIIRKMDNKELADIPIIALTANAFVQDKQKALSVGMNAHIAKPIHMDALKRVLSQFLQ